MGFAPSMMHGEIVGVDVQAVDPTVVKVTLSAEVCRVTVALKVPVTDIVTRQFTQGVPVDVLKFAWPAWVLLPVNGKVN